MKKVLLAAAAALLLPAAAQAAPAFNWSGPYVGVNAGYGLGHVAIDDQDCQVSCSTQNLSPNGLNIGGVLGYNIQHGSAVLGIEGDYNFSDTKRSKVTDWPSIHRGNINSFGSVRARAGLALDNTLVYVTGGMSIIDQDVAAQDFSGGVLEDGFSKHVTEVGLAVGAGAEMAISDHLRAKLEYMYLATPGDDNVRDQGTSCTSNSYCNFGYSTNLNVIRVGLNYAF